MPNGSRATVVRLSTPLLLPELKLVLDDGRPVVRVGRVPLHPQVLCGPLQALQSEGCGGRRGSGRGRGGGDIGRAQPAGVARAHTEEELAPGAEPADDTRRR